VTETLVASAAAAGRDAAALAAAVKELTQTTGAAALRRPRRGGSGASLRERRAQITSLLQPLAPLLDNATTPLGDALRRVLAALAEGASTSER
jgi:hypothetical protein